MPCIGPRRKGGTASFCRQIFFWGLCLLVVAGCGKPPAIRPLAADATVLAFGDSLTFGTGARPDESYPAVLATLLGCSVINAGVPGEVTAEGLARLPQVLDEHGPDLVILCHGGNDFLRRQNREETKANLRRMIALVKERGIDLLLLGVPEPGLLVSPAPLYKELAGEFGVPCDDETIRAILTDRGLKSDQIHPNGAGYRQLAEAVAALIREAGGG
ncbi:MAG: arylesterase [Thermodesulfobacteriota bacterium]